MIRSRLRSRGNATPWYSRGKADGIDPNYWADFVNNRYAASSTPMRVVTVRNQAYSARVNQSGMDGHLFKFRAKIGQRCRNLRLSFSNLYLVANTGDTNTGNSFTIQDVAFINNAGTVIVPVTFNGSRSVTITDGALDVQSDPIFPASFGLNLFSPDENYYMKGRITGAVDFFVPHGENTYLDSGMNRVWWYNTAATTPSSTDAAGNYTNAAGAALTSGFNGYCPFVIGRVVEDDFSLIAVGDSLAQGVGDTTSSEWGGGQIQRAMRSASNNDSLACLNFGIAGIRADVQAASLYTQAYMKYAKYAFVNLGTNDFNASATLATVQTRIQSVWAAIRVQGISTIIQQELFFYTTGTFTNDAGQTIVGGWGAGQQIDQFNAWLATKQADGTVNLLTLHNVIQSATDPNKWLANTTSDGIHPNSTGAENLAVVLRPLFRSLRSIAVNLSARSLSDMMTLTRASTATFFDSTGTMQTAGNNVLRFDFDPVTLQPRGVLIEDTRTNLVLNSATGTNQSVTVTATAHTLSFYGTGTVTLSGAFVGSLVGTGAYPVRSTLTFTPSAGSLTIACTGTIQFIQIEAGGQATSYIPTTGTTATRQIDQLVNSASNAVAFNTWAMGGVGTVVAEFSMPFSPTGATRVFEMWGSANESMALTRTSTVVQSVRRTGGVSEFMPAFSLSFTANGIVKGAATFVPNDFTVVANGGTPVTDATSPIPLPPIRVQIGHANGPASAINGHLRSLRWYPVAISDAELIRITT